MTSLQIHTVLAGVVPTQRRYEFDFPVSPGDGERVTHALALDSVTQLDDSEIKTNLLDLRNQGKIYKFRIL
jgi:hypothetical protein